MDFIFFLKGLIIGVLASIPLGPIGVLAIQRTLNKRFMSGFMSGLGAASADTIFAIAAMFFLSIISAIIEKRMQLLTIIGGLIVIGIGYSILTQKMSPRSLRKSRAQNGRYFRDYISTFFLTLANPAFIFVFVGLFTSFELTNRDLNIYNAIIAIIGVFLGASTWWFSLTSIVNRFRSKFRPRHLIMINRVAGSIILTLGVLAIVSALMGKF